MGAINKCNITSYVLPKIEALHLLLKCEDYDDQILENYIQYLSCSTYTHVTCSPDNCSNPVIVFVCTMALTKISEQVNNTNNVTFYIANGDLSNFQAPLTYSWSFDTRFFTPQGAINASTLTLVVNSNKDLDVLVFSIGLTITDANGCFVNKTCWFTPSGENCSDSYSPCVNANNLTLLNKVTNCVAPSGLIVGKKL